MLDVLMIGCDDKAANRLQRTWRGPQNLVVRKAHSMEEADVQIATARPHIVLMNLDKETPAEARSRMATALWQNLRVIALSRLDCDDAIAKSGEAGTHAVGPEPIDRRKAKFLAQLVTDFADAYVAQPETIEPRLDGPAVHDPAFA